MDNKKYLLPFLLAVLFGGCSAETREHKAFVTAYGSETRVFCRNGFKMKEVFLHKEATAPQLYLLDSQDCKKGEPNG